jgi:hypothetical protein
MTGNVTFFIVPGRGSRRGDGQWKEIGPTAGGSATTLRKRAASPLPLTRPSRVEP